MDKAYQTMSPKTVRSHQEHWCWKKYFALFNIFHQIILKQFSKVGAIPIIQMGKLRHTLTTQFSQHYITCQRSIACTHTPLALRGPMESTSSLIKAFYLLNTTQQIHMNYVTGGRVDAPTCLHCPHHPCPISGKASTSHTQSWHKTNPLPEHRSDGGRKLQHYPSAREKRPSDRTYRALALEYSKTPQSPRAERKERQDWILLNLSPGKEESQLFF